MTRVLIVEDNPAQLDLLTQRLRKRGFQTHGISDGRQALQYVMSRVQPNPHIILMDINLPGKNGIEVTEFLKRQNKTKHIVIIATSSALEGRGVARAIAAGFDEICKKPIEINFLVEKMQNLLLESEKKKQL